MLLRAALIARSVLDKLPLMAAAKFVVGRVGAPLSGSRAEMAKLTDEHRLVSIHANAQDVGPSDGTLFEIQAARAMKLPDRMITRPARPAHLNDGLAVVRQRIRP
ncbi:hypothetical protein ACVWXO_005395 [Bradyrhizobium sp. LM2.7]